ncbi:MAG TPA: SDR family NAD(P)-dependent oxidoreductase, partial [bacterium]|nr:SDR family NAD(P)-dependent oxidoreductase [bacterium]HXK95883.1 SDR family NAD(P)-dependent oxidoreductase [bacterium]
MNTLKRKYGPAALVTGASSGIGRAFAEELAARDFDLVLVARRGGRLEQIKNDLEARFGISVMPIVQDLTASGAVRRVCEEIQKSGWDIGLLINNAGFGSQGEFDTLDLENELTMVDLACRVPVELTHRLVPGMKQRRRGGIIFVSSVLSQFPSPYMATYAAGK